VGADSVGIWAGVGVPVKLLKEGEGHVITAELKSGDVYRGMLMESEDTMNIQLSDGE
jgi:small nuclear ribonucleoprotein D3